MEHVRCHRAVPQAEACRAAVAVRVLPARWGDERAERDVALEAAAVLRGGGVGRGGLARLAVLREEEGRRVPGEGWG